MVFVQNLDEIQFNYTLIYLSLLFHFDFCCSCWLSKLLQNIFSKFQSVLQLQRIFNQNLSQGCFPHHQSLFHNFHADLFIIVDRNSVSSSLHDSGSSLHPPTAPSQSSSNASPRTSSQPSPSNQQPEELIMEIKRLRDRQSSTSSLETLCS